MFTTYSLSKFIARLLKNQAINSDDKSDDKCKGKGIYPTTLILYVAKGAASYDSEKIILRQPLFPYLLLKAGDLLLMQ